MSMRPLHLAAACVAALLAAACLEPELIDDEDGPVGELPDFADETPVDHTGLIAEIDLLVAVVERADEHLTQAQDTDDITEAHRAALRALAELVDDDVLTDGERPASRALLPAETIDRAVTPVDPPVLISALAEAQETGGSLGRTVTDLLAETVGGDLGAWQRDAEGMVASARSAAETDAAIGDLERVILELPGEGLRAVAWTLVAADARDPERIDAAAERAQTHLQLIRDAFSELELP